VNQVGARRQQPGGARAARRPGGDVTEVTWYGWAAAGARVREHIERRLQRGEHLETITVDRHTVFWRLYHVGM